MKYYTGIGSRNTPSDILEIMQKLAYYLALDGYTLRSGGAEGADTAFAEGWGDAWATGAGPHGCEYTAEIYLPWEGFNDQFSSMEGRLIVNDPNTWAVAMEMASTIHPAWEKCSRGAKELHARNCYQVLGQDLKTPSKFVVCYAPTQGSSVKGGTRTAVELAKRNNIKVKNLYEPEMLSAVKEFIYGQEYAEFSNKE